MAKTKARRARSRQKAAEQRKISLRKRVLIAVVVVDVVLMALFTSMLTDAFTTAKRTLPGVAEVSTFAQTHVVEAAGLPSFDLGVDVPVSLDAPGVVPELELPPEIADALAQTAILDRARLAHRSSDRQRMTNVNVTFYDCANQGFCGRMYNGRKVYEGAAACSWNLSIGTRFRIVGDPTGRTYICEDRGLLANTWVDIFFYYPADGYRWQAQVGRYGTIEIVN